ncbi:type I restriction enzyme HsdR N-terminal domain-containing protein [Algoriphagus kandeliae]|uniref:Type I restriction enzyme HsdR N-terminal domain-containing protein n=1 Tax=Algoriphagus kandeliae TaxID=2562278 RepID=A0A4Y9QI59_9BACT|nr:type I restriction enzyme HsdR N-terminal domain-containing protein [Algoriphagus kandeliae]TFV92374.1 type I restriction enzyme HsdR N-terminal domain-containing protein [Algoriphagus kandeliae]
MNQKEFEEKYPPLNLPAFNPKLTWKEEKLWIFDSVRKKDLVLTPEEWVRQHWIYFLIEKQGFPKGLLSTEKGLVYNRLQKRTDVLIRDQNGNPYLLIECKAPKIPINQKTLEQATVYHFQLKSSFLILSNGFSHIFLQYHAAENRFSQEKNIPKPPICG